MHCISEMGSQNKAQQHCLVEKKNVGIFVGQGAGICGAECQRGENYAERQLQKSA